MSNGDLDGAPTRERKTGFSVPILALGIAVAVVGLGGFWLFAGFANAMDDTGSEDTTLHDLLTASWLRGAVGVWLLAYMFVGAPLMWRRVDPGWARLPILVPHVLFLLWCFP